MSWLLLQLLLLLAAVPSVQLRRASASSYRKLGKKLFWGFRVGVHNLDCCTATCLSGLVSRDLALVK